VKLLDLDAIFHPERRATQRPDLGPDDLPPDWRDWYEERAGIMEYEGKLPKEYAEAAAFRQTIDQMFRSGDGAVAEGRRNAGNDRPG
jgi:hypothetical protein